jgi:hypothetical protein
MNSLTDVSDQNLMEGQHQATPPGSPGGGAGGGQSGGTSPGMFTSEQGSVAGGEGGPVVPPGIPLGGGVGGVPPIIPPGGGAGGAGAAPDPNQLLNLMTQILMNQQAATVASATAPSAGIKKENVKVTLKTFNGSVLGWPQWEYQLLAYLKAHGVKPALDAKGLVEIPVVTDAKELENYEKLFAHVVNNITGEALTVVQGLEKTLPDMYRGLRDRFNPQAKGNRLAALKELLNGVMGASQTLASYIAGKEALFHGRLGGKVTTDEILILGLCGGLPAHFDQATANMLCEDNLDYQRLKRRLYEFEAVRDGNKEKEIDGAALYTKAYNEGFKKGAKKTGEKKKFDESKVKCWTCGEKGHRKGDPKCKGKKS